MASDAAPSPYNFPPASAVNASTSTLGITSSDPTSDVSSDAPSKYPLPSQEPQPQPQHQVPSPSPSPSDHSHVPHLRVQAQPQPISHQTTTSLSTSPLLYARLLTALTTSSATLGSGGSRLLIHNHAHAALETRPRLAKTFRAPAALLNLEFDANAGFFACVSQSGDALLYKPSMLPSTAAPRASRVAPRFCRPFAHNDVPALRAAP